MAHKQVPDEWNAITQRVIGAAIEVHSALGPGLLERIYEDAMMVELGSRGLSIQRHVPIRLTYKGVELSEQRLDLVVERLVVLELKSTDGVSDASLAQLVSYLRAGDLPLGLLINFNETLLSKGVFRRINPASSSFVSTTHTSLRNSVSSANSAFVRGEA